MSSFTTFLQNSRLHGFNETIMLAGMSIVTLGLAKLGESRLQQECRVVDSMLIK